MNSRSAAFRRGYAAANEGRSLNQVPYGRADIATAWEEGWKAAKRFDAILPDALKPTDGRILASGHPQENWQQSLESIRKERSHLILWNREQFTRACSPMVYIAWSEKRTEKPLYVGMSKLGLQRPLNTGHHVLSRIRDHIGFIEFICCGSVQEAESLEKRLIRMLAPEFNGVFNGLQVRKTEITVKIKREPRK